MRRGQAILTSPELAIPPQQIRREMTAALERTRHFAVREGASARVRLDVESARRLTGERESADVQLVLELSAASPEGELERTVAEGSGRATTAPDAGADAEARIAAFDAALQVALEDAARGLAWQLESRRKTDDELVRDLADPDPRVRDYAVRSLADRRSPAVVPQLIARLEDDNPAVALRAVGALVAIGTSGRRSWLRKCFTHLRAWAAPRRRHSFTRWRAEPPTTRCATRRPRRSPSFAASATTPARTTCAPRARGSSEAFGGRRLHADRLRWRQAAAHAR